MAATHPLHQDPTLRAILRDILEAPDDDGPRLVYADRVEDLGDFDMAEFIRVQVALAALGEERAIALNVVLRSHGPDYWTTDLSTEAMGSGPYVGQRVDVVPYRWEFKRGGANVGKNRTHHGLLITKILDGVERGDPRSCVLKRDKDSLPWVGEPLRRRQNELLPDRRNLVRWCPRWVVEPGSGGGGVGLGIETGQSPQERAQALAHALERVHCDFPPALVYNAARNFFVVKYRRGFVGSVTTRSQTFLQRAHDIFDTQPVRRVRLIDLQPEIDRVADENGGYTDYIWRSTALPPELLMFGSHTFRTRDEADLWLSQRCVAHGKSPARNVGGV